MSGNIFPNRFTKVDDLTRADHSYLTPEDQCFFLGEYTTRAGFSYSDTNNFIANFKKSVDRRGKSEWSYKESAIREAATAFQKALPPRAMDDMTFVPIPPSKSKADTLYDDRLTRMLHAIRPMQPLDVREIIIQTESRGAAHESERRPRPEEIGSHYRIDETLIEPKPQKLVVVDDVLTTGAHFRAVKALLVKRLRGVDVVGLFIARRAPNTTDPAAFENIKI